MKFMVPMGQFLEHNFTAATALYEVRKRVGMPPVRAEYTVDKQTFRERIYNERAVELYMEFHRWTDIRRWRLAKGAVCRSEVYKGSLYT